MFYTTYKYATILGFVSALGCLLAAVFYLLNSGAEQLITQPAIYWEYLTNNPDAALYQVLESVSILLMGVGVIAVVIAYRSLLHAYRFLNDFAAICGFLGIAILMINASSTATFTYTSIELYNQSEMGKTIVTSLPESSIDPKAVLSYSMLTIWLIIINSLHLQERNIPNLLGYIGIIAGILMLLAPLSLLIETESLLFIGFGLGMLFFLTTWLIWSSIFFSSIEPASNFE